ncbi:MAG: PAS domain S-box protein [Deltaproteobacteria bacterium]|nr:PAS domain S-box protein [Deltaproteobacteria bacterium]
MNILKEVLEENHAVKQAATKPLGEEMEFFRQHNEILFKKLEKKMLDLEIANQELKILEEKYRLSFENVTDVIFMIDADLNVSSVSPSVERILGYKPQDFIGRPVSDLGNILTPESLEQAMADISMTLKSETNPVAINRFIAKDGTIKYGEVSGSPMMRDGKIIGMIAVARDITERKHAEDTLRESEEKFRVLADSTPTAIMLYQDDRWIYANQAAEAICGYSAKELLTMDFWDFVHPDHKSLIQERGRKRQQGEGTTIRYELKIIAKDGIEKWVELSGASTTLRGRPAGIISVLDITDRKRAEEALRETQGRLADIIEFLPDATLVIDRAGKVIAWNRAIESMTGVKAEEMLGKGNYEYAHPFYGERKPILIDLALHPDPEKEKTYTSIQRTGDIIIGEAYTPALVPGDVHLSATASVLRDSRGEIIAAIECIRNNTDRKKMEERLQRSEKMEALGVLAGGVAHDLNNVLGVLVGYSELLLREFPEGSRAGKYAKSILQGGERAAAIIQDLLTMARRGVSVSETINLNRIVSDFFKTPEFERVKLHHPDILFRSQLETDLFNIKGSPVHLFKTIMNLLSNAAESIRGAGEVTITTENRYVDVPIPGYENTREGEYVVLTVSDTGSGISPAELGRIFEPFYTKKVMGRSGTGLGLAVVWGTIKDHGGYIDVHSEENKGSTFILYFPVTRETLSKRDKDLSPETYHGRGEGILIVDDVEAQRLLAATILENLNYRVATAASGEDAVEYLRANKADLIVLDMIMDPGIDGLETYRRILEIRPQQKAIIVSGFAKTDRVNKAQELGAGEYVKKPYVIEKLGVAVRRELDRI